MTDELMTVQDLRNRILKGEQVDAEEFNLAVRDIRNLRRAAAGKPGTKSSGPKKSADDLLNEVF